MVDSIRIEKAQNGFVVYLTDDVPTLGGAIDPIICSTYDELYVLIRESFGIAPNSVANDLAAGIYDDDMGDLG